ncbi:DUF1737 domain-containing protein [Actinomadura algeriensis]|uniref:DUF1737 domain-containing protein n=1 Tax=Actinomadura algeriensis TaxID=1679523 RepID=A0ABR9JUN7_9ACTN|nr:DUF1737 domain-containing protein [Actinomadura algeriensis]MBE1534265.1 hypothetical protein [Actinomadura algeriensis]
MTVSQYHVVTGSNAGDLINAVNKLIKEGWQPLGGLCTNGAGYWQAMVR